MKKQNITFKTNRVFFNALTALLLLTLPSFIFAQEKNKAKSAPSEDNSVQVVSVQGIAQAQKANTSEWLPAAPGTKLYSQDKIRTLIDSLATLRYPDDTQLILRENSLLTIQDVSKDSKTGLTKRELKLDTGGMKYKVSRIKEKGSEFKIHTSTAIVGVTGTEGSIETGGEGKPTKNTLAEGSTYNTDEQGKGGRPLNAGNSWEIDDKAQSEKHMATPQEINDNIYKGKDPAAEKRFNDFMQKINQKRDQGYNLSPVSGLLEQILEAMSKNDSLRLNPLLEEAEKLLDTLKKSNEPKAKEADALIQVILQEIEAKKREGYDLTRVYALLAQAQTAYQEEKYAEVQELLEQTKHDLGALVKKADDFKARLEAFEDELNNKAKAGFIIRELIEIVKQIKIYFNSASPAQAEGLLNKAKEMLAAAKRQIPAELLKTLEDIKTETANKKNEGFDVAELKELIDLADKAREENEYLKLEELLAQIKEKLKPGLTKAIPQDLLLSFNNFQDLLKKKQDAGFDILPLQNLIKSVYDAKEKGDFTALRQALTQAQDALLKLALPEQFLKHFQELKDELKKKKDAGYEVKEIEDRITQAQVMFDKGSLSEIPALFLQAETALNTIKDIQPPLLQVGDLAWSADNKSIGVSGIAKDNIKVSWVSVNGDLVNLDTAGGFKQDILLSPLLTEIIIQAQDSSGNPAPQIQIPVPEDKLKSLPKPDDTIAPELKAEDIRLTYIMPDELKIDGKTEANALIALGEKNILADNQGVFSTQIKTSKELIEKGLAIISRDAAGNSSLELKIPVPDKWPPIIHSAQPVLSDQIPPSLKVNNLVYEKDKIKVSGACQDVANIIVKVEAEDTGSEIKEYTFNAAKSQSPQDTLMLTPDLKSVDIAIADKQGNLAKTNAAIDFFLKPAIVMVNGKEIPLDKDGAFSTEITPQADMHQVVIEAKDSAGNVGTPVKLAIADIIPPSLILGDLVYSKDSVEINGKTDPYAVVNDKNGKLFNDKITADNNGVFKIKIKRPKELVTGMLIAEDASGNRSAEINVTIEPLTDKDPPQLMVANLEYKGNKVIVSGSSEDDTGIKSVTVNDQAVELRNNLFSSELELTPQLQKIEVVAADLSGKTTSILKVVEDSSKPEIAVSGLTYENGYCLVKGKALDNLGLKEVRINNVPVPFDAAVGDFEYRLPITAQVKEITAAAVDLYGNFSEIPPQAITLPEDNIPPTLTLNELAYGSPIVIVSGLVKDNVGIKQVLINGSPVNFYEDGSFKTQLPIKSSSPQLSLNDPIYDNGLVTVSGRVNPGAREPREIIAQAEDLSGNKSAALKKEPLPFQLADIKVMVDDRLVELENGSFSTKLALEKGMQEIKVNASDPFGNSAQELAVPLEKIPPIIELNEPRYSDNNVTISGTAKDNGAGISEVLINAVSAQVAGDGKFSQTFIANESSITVLAIDRLGNMATAPPVKLTPLDKAAPVFIVKVTPTPAIIGKNVFISIDALDSKTRLPEILPNPPEVKAALPNAQNLSLKVDGQGASFNAALDTNGLASGTVNLKISGTDSAGNTGDKIEGASLFLLNTQDTVPPALKIIVSSPSPLFAGTDANIIVTASETLKTLPKAEISLPGGAKFALNLEGSLSGTSFSKNISLPQDLPPGEAIITVSGAVDLAGNTQTASEEFRFFVRPQTAGAAGGLTLRLEAPEITPERISLKGITSPGAIAHLSAANIQADIPADENGRFNFIRQISRAELDNWLRLYPDGFIPVNCFSANYAGVQSEIISLKFPLPRLTAEAKGAFVIEIQPEPVEQGRPVNILIKSPDPFAQPPRAIIKFVDGRTEPLSLSGQGKEFSAVYPTTIGTRPGPAVIEARTEKFFQTRSFIVVPPGQAMMGRGFYIINARPDPGIIGKEAEFSVQLERPIEKPLRLQIRLPNGKTDAISLSGEGLEFKGKYTCPANIMPGPAELIINDGEYRRPYGISSQGAFGQEGPRMFSGLIAYTNPSPMLAGSSAAINVRSDRALDFAPKADLRLTNGRLITIALSGATPGNNFSGQANIPIDAPFGPAAIVLKNERGEIVGEHPANIAPAYTTMAAKEVDALMSPFSTMPGQPVTITITSRKGPFTIMPQAKLIFSNNLVFPLRLEGALPTATLTCAASIPPSASAGPVSINILDENNRPIGNGQGMIGMGGMPGPGAGGPRGDININIMPPYIMPGNNFEIQVYSASSLYLLPKASLDIPGKGTKDLRLEGQVPGNSFRAQIMFPRDAKVRGSKIDVRFDRGAGEETRSIFLEGGGDEERREFRPPKLTPYPPIPGQPLMLTLYAPEQVDFIPLVRVNYHNGQNEPIPLSGPVPGDTFSGTLARVIAPLKSIDIFDPEDNNLLISLPIEMFGGYGYGPGAITASPILEVTPPQPLMPPVIANINIKFPQPVPMIPRVNIRLPDGRNINVFVNGAVPGTFFNGVLQVPADSPSGPSEVQVYLGDQMVPGMPSIMIGGGTFNAGDILNLKTFPNGPVGEISVDWLIMPNAMKHRLTYQAPGVPSKTIDLGRIGHYILTGLKTGVDYQIMLSAQDQGGKEFARSERMVRVPETGGMMPGFPVYVHSAGPDSLQINWEPQFNATNYELHYTLAPADPMTGQLRPVGNTASYMLGGLANGTYRIIIEAVFAAGERKKSHEAAGTVGAFNIGKPPVTLIPNPPITGQPLEIQITTPMVIPVIPKLSVKYAAQGEEFVTLTGAVPGSSFAGRLPFVKEQVAFINIFDPLTNELKYSYPVSANFITPIIPGGGIINVTPDPPMTGQTLNISAICDKPQALLPYARLYFTDRPSEDRLMTGAAGGTVFNYAYPMLPVPLMRIEIWDNAKLTKIAERPFGAMGPMPGGMGIIDITNPPPVAGKTLNIVLRNIPTQMNLPKVHIYFKGPIAPWIQQMNGAVPGTTFTANTTPLPYDVERIEAWDYTKTIQLAPNYYYGGGPGPGGTGGTIVVNPPCPRKGDTATVSTATSSAQPLQPYARFFFVDRPYQDMLMLGPAGGLAFNYTYSNLPADVIRVELWDNGKANMIANLPSVCGAGAGNPKADIFTTPGQPAVGTYTSITVNIIDPMNGQPFSILQYPQIYAKFINEKRPLPARGALPGSTFSSDIPASNFTTELNAIIVEHNGVEIGRRDFMAGPIINQLNFACNSPYAGQEIRCIADIPLSQPALTERPEAHVFYPAGTSPLDELMTVTGALPGWHFEAVVSQAKTRPDRAELKLANGYRQTFYFTPVGPGTIPFDPPCPVNIGQPLSYCMTLPSPQPAPPYIRIHFKDNSPAPLEYLMTGSGTYFCANTPNLTNYVERFELWDNARTAKLGEKFCGMMGTDCWNINVTPDPPRISEPCSVTLTNPCGRQINMSPYLHVTFDNGTTKDYTMNGGLPGTTFSFTIPANEMTRNVTAIDGWDNNRVKLPGPTRYWGAGGPPSGYGEIDLIPPCPARYTPVNIEARNLAAQPSLPWVRVYYKEGYPMSENQMNGALPGTNFNFYLSSVSNTIDHVEVWDNARTYRLAEKMPNCAAGCPDQYALTLEIRPMPYNVGQTTTLAFDLPLSQPYISARPTAKVYYNTQGSETVNLPSGVVPGWHFEGSFIPKENFSSVEIDLPGCWMKNFPATSYQNTDYPTNLWDESTGDAYSRKIHWNTVGGATGYDIYCGLSNPPSIKWKEVIGGSIASEIITGLTVGSTYYYTVKVRGGDKFERVPSFVAGTGTSGGGSGKIKILSPYPGPDGAIECNLPDTNPGYTSGSLNITIQNIGTSNINLKRRGGLLVKMNDPYKTIPAASINFPDNLTISAGTTVIQAISITVPTGTTSGNYTNRGPGAELLTLFDDVNNNGNYESAEESGINIAINLYAGTWVAGIDVQEPGVDFGTVNSGTTSTTQTVHISNTIASVLTNVKSIPPMLGLMGGGGFINSSNVTFNLNSSVSGVLGPGETTNSTVRVFIPEGTASGTYGGMLTIYNDTNNNSSVDEGVEPYETIGIMVRVTSVAGGVDHFTLSTVPSGIATSPVGKPVLIKVTAYASTGDTTIAASFSSSVAMNVTGSSYILSLQDRVTKISSQLQISSGIGYCTLDAVSSASLGISVSGYTSNTLSINFTTPTGSDLDVKQLAADFERETAVGGSSTIQVFTVTDYGKSAANYTGTINFIFTDPGAASLTLTKVSGGGTLSASPPYAYNFVSGDNGKASFNLTDTEAETIPFSIADTGNTISASGTIQFTGVQKFIVEPANPVVRGYNIQIKAYSATNSGRKLGGYNGAVTWQRVSEIGGSSLNSSGATAINFVDGEATFTLSDTEYEMVTFRLTDGGVNSDDIIATFSSATDSTPPVLTAQTTAETPFLIHLYFSKDIDSANALVKDNYDVGSNYGNNINKVCWYGSDVTLHLATPLSPLGSAKNISVKAYSVTVPYGIKDVNGNGLNAGADQTVSVTVPTVDYQGSSYGSGDWLEIQTAPSQVPIGAQTVKVIIYQKNACGYLSGTNRVNRSTDVPNVNLTYANPQYLTGPSGSQTMTDGKCEFNLTTNFTASGQTVTITASSGGVTSGAATITSQ